MLEIVKTFGERLQELRKERRMTQQELADKLGLHNSFIGLLERGERIPSLITINNIATLFGIKAHNLLSLKKFNLRKLQFEYLILQTSDSDLFRIYNMVLAYRGRKPLDDKVKKTLTKKQNQPETFLDLLATFAENFQKLRKEHHMTQEDLADKLGLHNSYIGLLERAERVPSLLAIDRIAKVFSITVADLLESKAEVELTAFQKHMTNLVEKTKDEDLENVYKIFCIVIGDPKIDIPTSGRGKRRKNRHLHVVPEAA